MLDYETLQIHYVQVVATYKDGTQTYTVVAVHVGDENDNAPRIFAEPPISRLVQNAPDNTLVTRIEVEDKDTSKEFTYNITTGNLFLNGDPDTPLFRIESNGMIKTTRCIQESEIGNHVLTIIVDDQVNTPTVLRNMQVQIKTTDDKSYVTSCGLNCPANDGPISRYQFEKGLFVVNVPENAAVPSTLLELSRPFVENTNFSVGSGADSKFTVNENGSLVLIGELDYEMKAIYYFIVTASIPSQIQGKTLEAIGGYLIIVGDVDDSSPVITDGAVTIIASETTGKGQIIGCLKIKDTDSSNSLMYTVTNGSEYFTIDSNGDVTVIKQLNAANSPYNVHYEVSDGINPPSSASFTVYVNETNNHIPKFSKNVYDVTVKEGSINAIILNVTATDGDIGDTIKYSLLVDDGGSFILDSGSGALTLRGTVNFETKKEYNLVIQAADQNGNGFSSVAFVRVTVEDQNDIAPVINNLPQGTTVSVHENTVVGSTVFRVIASDGDSNDVLKYFLMAPNDFFSIDPNSGEVKIIDSLLKSQIARHVLQIQVNDSVGNTDIGSLTIQIERSGSSQGCVKITIPSTSQNNILIPVNETTEVNTTIFELTAGDANSFSDITFSLDPESSETFTISKDGKLSLKKALDFETKSFYPIKITVTDNIRQISSQYNVFVQVTDYNEKAPTAIITDPIRVSELANDNDIIGQVLGSDDDVNAKLTYSLKNDSNGAFDIDPDSGNIILKRKLTSSDSQIEVCVSDGTKTTCKTVNVTVTDENNNPPVFEDAIATGAVQIPITGETYTVYRPNINDADGNSNFTYSFKDTPNEHFKINPDGSVYTDRNLTAGTYTFQVCANDGIYTTCQPVTVLVSQGQIGPQPNFTKSYPGISIKTSDPNGTFIVQVTAQTNDNQPIKYTIQNAAHSEIFAIDENSGEVTLRDRSKLLEQSNKLYDIVIRGERRDNSSSFGQVNIGIIVASPNDDNGSTIVQVANTQMIVNFSLSTFDHGKVSHYVILGQRAEESYESEAEKTPVSWFYVNLGEFGYPFRYYYVANIKKDEINLARRKRRELLDGSSASNSFTYKVGNEPGCFNKTGINDVCNGQLKVGTLYR